MTLFLALALFLQPPSATSKVTKDVVVTQEVTVESAPFTADSDNAPIINAFLESLPAGSVVTLPAGVWPIKSPVQVNKPIVIESAANWPATLKLIASNTDADVLRVGKYSDPGSFRVNGVTLRRLTLEVAGEKTKGQMQCLEVQGDDFTAEDCTFIGSPHEGVVVHGLNRRATFLRCTAINCGNGNEFYERSTAGFNAHAYPTIYTQCVTRGCGQGYEIDGYHTRVTECEAHEPGPGTPSIAFNVGSTGMGIYDVQLHRCKTSGYVSALGVGNGIGRLANVEVWDCIFDGGAVGVSGGIPENKNPGGVAWIGEEGPDGGHSKVCRCTFIVRGSHGGIYGINTGPADLGTPNVYGREQWTFDDNTVVFVGVPDEHGPIGYIAGNQSAPVSMLRLKVFGRDTGPSRGDIAVFSNNANKVGTPPLTYSGTAFRKDGTQRPLVVNIEGKQ
jgi:hypothetical protein